MISNNAMEADELKKAYRYFPFLICLGILAIANIMHSGMIK